MPTLKDDARQRAEAEAVQVPEVDLLDKSVDRLRWVDEVRTGSITTLTSNRESTHSQSTALAP